MQKQLIQSKMAIQKVYTIKKNSVKIFQTSKVDPIAKTITWVTHSSPLEQKTELSLNKSAEFQGQTLANGDSMSISASITPSKIINIKLN